MSHGPFDFRMPIVTDQYTVMTTLARFNHFQMYFGNQRTGGIENLQVSLSLFLLDFAGNSMRTENNQRHLRDFTQLIHKHDAFLLELLYDCSIMHHAMADIFPSPI